MLESTSVYSTITSGCSSLEYLDPPIRPEAIYLTQFDDSMTSYCMPKELNETEELTKVDINKIPTNWDGYSQGGEIISKMANVTYVTSAKYYNTTPSAIATTTPIWVKHYRK